MFLQMGHFQVAIWLVWGTSQRCHPLCSHAPWLGQGAIRRQARAKHVTGDWS